MFVVAKPGDLNRLQDYTLGRCCCCCLERRIKSLGAGLGSIGDSTVGMRCMQAYMVALGGAFAYANARTRRPLCALITAYGKDVEYHPQ